MIRLLTSRCLIILLMVCTSASAAELSIILNELKVNPPGTNDSPYEFIELLGAPGALLDNTQVFCITGDAARNPGTVIWRADLAGCRLGSNGLLLIAATNCPYGVPPETTVIGDSPISMPGGALGNGTISVLLVRSANAVVVGEDLDHGNNGVLEGLPPGTAILDAVAWDDGGRDDVVYGAVVLKLSGATPDAATRLSWDHAPKTATAWVCGDLEGQDGSGLVYDLGAGSPGTQLSPGDFNNIAPSAIGLGPISGVIGDPSNPVLRFVVSDDQTDPDNVVVSATSDNLDVVPNAHLAIGLSSGGIRTLSLTPVGVGYATITIWLSEGSQTGRVNLAYAASAPGRPGTAWHLAASDASTAIALDDQYMIVGDDENQVLRLYPRGQSGLPLAQYDMTSHLGLPDVLSGVPREVDVEASTRVGNRLFWIGSLGHAATGESRTNRTRVFATDLLDSGLATQLTYAGRYDYLKVDLIAWDTQNLHGKGTNHYGLEASDADGVPPKAPDGSGFAIEGLAMMPGSTNGAFIGFRAPIVPATNRTCALIVPVLNFATIAASGGPPGSAIFGPPVELDLYNRGIRSIEGNTDNYFIIAGPPGTTGLYPADFRLYSWTGDLSSQPIQRSADLAGLNPEGIVALPDASWSSATQIQLLSDEGTTVYYGDGIQAKFLREPNFKKARSDWVTIGPPAKPAPFIVSTELSETLCIIRWRSLEGETYQVQHSSDLATGQWEEVPGWVTASSAYASKSIPKKPLSDFIRVVLLP